MQSPEGEKRRLQIQADIEHFNTTDGANDILYRANKQEENERPRFHEFGDDLIIITVSNFVMSQIDFDTVISKMRKHKAVVLDMRGNPGGAVSEVEDFLRNIMNHDVHIGDRVTRGGRKAENIRGFGNSAYTGKITVLIDSQSASAAEVTSRVLQLEKRGTVIGDLSSGKVMEARTYVDFIGAGRAFGYATSVTDADLIMSDGKSIENIGVTPTKSCCRRRQSGGWTRSSFGPGCGNIGSYDHTRRRLQVLSVHLAKELYEVDRRISFRSYE